MDVTALHASEMQTWGGLDVCTIQLAQDGQSRRVKSTSVLLSTAKSLHHASKTPNPRRRLLQLPMT